jgi:hypothetical protein
LHNQGYVIFPRSAQPPSPVPVSLADSLFGELDSSAPVSVISVGESWEGRSKPTKLCVECAEGEEETTFPPTPDSLSPRCWHSSGLGACRLAIAGEEETTFPPTPDSLSPRCWRGMNVPSTPDSWQPSLSTPESCLPFWQTPDTVGERTLLGAGPESDSAPATQAPGGEAREDEIWRVPLLTPATMDALRSSARRTFIHVEEQLQTPRRVSSSRSLSVPRDML